MAILIPQQGDVRTPMNDNAIGGQNGLMTDPQNWTSSAPYVRQHILPVLVTAPALMQYLQDPAKQIAALKAVMELMPQKISGLTSTVSWEYDGANVGHAGEKLVAPIKASRAVSAPQYEWMDRHGQALTRFWTELGRLFIGDPELQAPGIVQNAQYIAANSPQILPEQRSITMLFIEPDTTMTKVTNAWLCTNMMPDTGGEIVGSREMGGSLETPTVSITFTALTMTGQAVYTLAANYLKLLKLQDLRPLELKGFTDKISPDVDSAATGLKEEISTAVLNG